jgi:hypothetical protein
MKEEVPPGNPFIGEPRGGRLAKYGGWAASLLHQKMRHGEMWLDRAYNVLEDNPGG